MKKTVTSTLKTGARIGLAGLALGATALKAKATTLDYVNTVISGGSYGGDVDQDPTRDGVQLRYDWVVRNDDLQGFTSDAIFNYTIQADLESRGMYGFGSDANGTQWSSSADSLNDTYTWLADQAGNFPIRSGITKTFSALIDEFKVTGNEQVGSYGISNEGATSIVNVKVPKVLVLSVTGSSIAFETSTNVVYTVYLSPNLVSGGWGAVTTFSGNGSVTNIPMAVTSESGFYKVEAAF